MSRAEGRGPGAEGRRPDALKKFGGYIKTLELFGNVAEDMEGFMGRFHLQRLISQQIASADSVAANIEEGYGRGSQKDYIKFLMYSRGSARETAGRYERFQRWLPSDLLQKRVNLCEEIIAILSASIIALSKSEKKDPPPEA